MMTHLQWQHDYHAISVLFKREWRRAIREPSRFLGIVIQPLLFWLVIGSGFMPNFQMKAQEGLQLNYMQYFFPGVLSMVVLFTAIFSTISLIEDRASGFLQTVLVAPARRVALVMGKVSAIVSMTLLQAFLFVLVAPFAGIAWSSINWPLLLTMLILGGAAIALVGFIFAWWINSSSGYHAVMSVILIPLWVVSGAMFPLTAPWMKWISWVNPQAWTVSGLQRAFGQEGLPYTEMGLLSLFIVGAFTLAAFLCERRQRD